MLMKRSLAGKNPKYRAGIVKIRGQWSMIMACVIMSTPPLHLLAEVGCFGMKLYS